nr:PREDICTED: uncharacterized protein LOC109038933 isoform X1 [Bemisia tabaci]
MLIIDQTFQNSAMGGDQTCYSECRKLVENLVNDISSGLDGIETEVLPKISLLKKSIGVLIDQSVSVSRAHIYKDFLSEFADVDIKTRVQTKIFNALEEEISKLKLLVNDQDMKLMKCRSAMVPLETFTLSLKESHVNLLNAVEMTKDCSQIFTYLCIKLQIATACIKYEDISSLNKLTNFPNDIRNAKKTILEKKKAIADLLLLPMNEEEIKLVTVGN